MTRPGQPPGLGEQARHDEQDERGEPLIPVPYVSASHGFARVNERIMPHEVQDGTEPFGWRCRPSKLSAESLDDISNLLDSE